MHPARRDLAASPRGASLSPRDAPSGIAQPRKGTLAEVDGYRKKYKVYLGQLSSKPSVVGSTSQPRSRTRALNAKQAFHNGLIFTNKSANTSILQHASQLKNFRQIIVRRNQETNQSDLDAMEHDPATDLEPPPFDAQKQLHPINQGLNINSSAMASPAHERSLKQHEQHRYQSNHHPYQQDQSGSLSRSVIREQTQEDAGTKDEKAFETLISYDNKATGGRGALGAALGGDERVGGQTGQRESPGREELLQNQDNHLVVLGNDYDIEYAHAGETWNPPHHVLKKGSRSLREREEAANENNGCGVDEAGSSTTKGEIKFLRAADSEE